MDGIYLSEPHGRLIYSGEKSTIATVRRLASLTPGDYIVVSKDGNAAMAFGIATIGPPAALSIEQFDDAHHRHRVSRKARRKHWADAEHLYEYPILYFTPYPTPRQVEAQPGVSMLMGEVKFTDGADDENVDTKNVDIKDEEGDMPYTVADPPRPAKNWTKEQKRKCVEAANAVLRDDPDNEQGAIFACIRAAGKTKHPGGKKSAGIDPSDYAIAEGLVTGFVEAETKARGEGQGVGGPRQGDAGATTCVCPKCGHELEHNRGIPCTEVKCPECGATMEGKDEKGTATTQLAFDELATKAGDDGSSDAGTCTCPNCGYIADKSTDEPCTEQTCPECGTAMRGGGSDDEKATTKHVDSPPSAPNSTLQDSVPDSIISTTNPATKSSILHDLKTKFTEWISKMLDTGENVPDTRLSFKTFTDKSTDDTWFVLWPTNAYEDRDEEFFASAALEAFVGRHDANDIKGEAQFWHIPGSTFGTIREQAVVSDHFLVQLGTFDPTPTGDAFKAFFLAHPDGHPDIAPDGWGASHGFNYVPADRIADGIFNWFETKESSVLPYAAASNQHNPTLEVFQMNDRQAKAITAIGDAVGADLLTAITDTAAAKREELDGKVEHKNAQSGTGAPDVSTKDTQTTQPIPGAVEAATVETTMKALAAAVTEQIVEQLQLTALSSKLEGMDKTITDLSGNLEAVTDRVTATEVSDDRRLAEKMEAAPRFAWFQASQATETVLNPTNLADAALKSAKPTVPRAVVSIASKL